MATVSKQDRFDGLKVLLYEQNQFVIKYDLESMATAARLMGVPPPATKVVLVGGTNGKGTTGASLNAFALRAGLRVGFYSSPHLLSLRERIRINGAPITRDEFCDRLEPIFARFSGRGGASDAPRALSYFELLTLTAWSHFASSELDLAVFEVGLGGRLDATNTLEPDISIITSVALDHQDYLGDTLEAIAAEKAGIVRSGRLTLAHVASGGFEAVEKAVAVQGGHLGVVTEGSRPAEWNAALAWRAFSELYPAHATSPVREDGLAGVRWPGRKQVMATPAGRRLYLDGAHNPHAVAETVRWLAECAPAPIPVVFGLSGKRDPAPLLALLKPIASRVIVTECISAPAVPTPIIVEAARTAEIPVEVAASPADALERVPEDVAVVGSLYLVGDVMAAAGTQLSELRIYSAAGYSKRSASSR